MAWSSAPSSPSAGPAQTPVRALSQDDINRAVLDERRRAAAIAEALGADDHGDVAASLIRDGSSLETAKAVLGRLPKRTKGGDQFAAMMASLQPGQEVGVAAEDDLDSEASTIRRVLSA